MDYLHAFKRSVCWNSGKRRLPFAFLLVSVTACALYVVVVGDVICGGQAQLLYRMQCIPISVISEGPATTRNMNGMESTSSSSIRQYRRSLTIQSSGMERINAPVKLNRLNDRTLKSRSGVMGLSSIL